MSIEGDFYTLLSNAAGVTALVSARIYPDVLPEECVYPAVVFARTQTDREPYRGLSGHVFGADVELSVGCWARTRTAADSLAAAVEAALSGSAFISSGPAAAFDPETGLMAATLPVSAFEPY